MNTIPADVMQAAAKALFADGEFEPDGLYDSREQFEAHKLSVARAILSERDRATAAERARCTGLAEDAAEQALRALGGFTASNAAFFMEGKFRALLAAIRNPMEGMG